MNLMLARVAERRSSMVVVTRRHNFGRDFHAGGNRHLVGNYHNADDRVRSFDGNYLDWQLMTSRTVESQRRYQSDQASNKPKSSPFAAKSTPKSPFDATASAVAAHADTSNTAARPKPRRRRELRFVPRKAAVQMTEKARNFFRALLEVSKPDIIGIMLKYDQSSTGEPRMVFSFDFVRAGDLTPEDEGVSLEVNADGKPKSPEEAVNDGLKKLYIHHGAFLKALGCTVDVDTDNIIPILYDRDGNKMDPNF